MSEVETSATVAEAIAALFGAAPLEDMEPSQALTVAFEALVPAVPIPAARKMLGNKSRSEMYQAAAAGLLTFIKDGSKTLVTTKSIRSYQATRWKPAAVKLYAPSRRRRRRRSEAAGSTKPARKGNAA